MQAAADGALRHLQRLSDLSRAELFLGDQKQDLAVLLAERTHSVFQADRDAGSVEAIIDLGPRIAVQLEQRAVVLDPKPEMGSQRVASHSIQPRQGLSPRRGRSYPGTAMPATTPR